MLYYLLACGWQEVVKKMEQQKWMEIFSQGDIWELKQRDGKLLAMRIEGAEAENYSNDELVDNGISTVKERARIMGLELVEVGL